MMPMRRRTSSVVIPAAPRAAGRCRCAATGTGSTVSSRIRRYRITRGLDKRGANKLTRPAMGDIGRPGRRERRSSWLAALQLGLGPWLVPWRVMLWLHARLAPGWRSLTPRLCALLGLGRTAHLPGRRLHLGPWNDARAAQISTADADLAPLVVVHGTRAHTRDEGIGCLAVLENEAWLWPERPRKNHPRRAIGAIGVIVWVVEHHDPKADAGVVVRAPMGVAHVRMAVVAQEPRIVVVSLDVIRRKVVVPIAVPVGHDAPRQLRDRHVRVAVHPAVGDGAIVPMVVAFERVVGEGVARGNGEDVPHARVVVDVEGVAVFAARDLVVPAAAREVVFPRLAREQDPHPAIGVDAQDGDERVLPGTEVHAHALAVGVGIVAAVGPDLDTRAVREGGGLERGAPDGADEAEQAERDQHDCLPPLRGAGVMPSTEPRDGLPTDCRSRRYSQARAAASPLRVLYPGQSADH